MIRTQILPVATMSSIRENIEVKRIQRSSTWTSPYGCTHDSTNAITTDCRTHDPLNRLAGERIYE